MKYVPATHGIAILVEVVVDDLLEKTPLFLAQLGAIALVNNAARVKTIDDAGLERHDDGLIGSQSKSTCYTHIGAGAEPDQVDSGTRLPRRARNIVALEAGQAGAEVDQTHEQQDHRIGHRLFVLLLFLHCFQVFVGVSFVSVSI